MKNGGLQILVNEALQNHLSTDQIFKELFLQKQCEIICEHETMRSLKQLKKKTKAGKDIRLRCKVCKHLHAMFFLFVCL